MRSTLSLILVLTIPVVSGSFFLSGCKERGVEPPPPPKDPRTYTWTVDTLAYPGSFQTLMLDIWGSSSSNLYVVGHNDQNRGLMWHYNGNTWNDVRLSTTQGGNIAGPIDLTAIYGFAANDIWAVGSRIFTNSHPPPNFFDSSLAVHYDGVRWREVSPAHSRSLQCVFGTSSSNIWTGSINGTLYHYEGNGWTRDSVPLPIPPEEGPRSNVVSIAGHPAYGIYLLISAQRGSLEYSIFYTYQRMGNTWTIVDSSETTLYAAWMSSSGTLYAVGGGVYRWSGQDWQGVLEAPEYAIVGIHGTSDDNIFAVGGGSRIFHWNGIDWIQFTQFEFSDVFYNGIWTDGREAFIVGWTIQFPQRTIILHGK